MNAKILMVHAQIIVSHPVKSKIGRASDALRQQAIHHDVTYHLVYKILDVPKGKQPYELKIRLIELPAESDFTWKPVENIPDDFLGILENVLHTTGNLGMKHDTTHLY